MKLKTFVTIVTLTAFSILLAESSIAYPCEAQDSTPAQSLKTLHDDQSALVFEVASNYRAVAKSRTEGGVWKEIYIMEPTAYCYLQSPDPAASSEALMGASYVLIELFSGDIKTFLNNLGQEPYRETLINGSKALVGNNVVAINRRDGQYWAIIHDTTSSNQDYAGDKAKLSRNNQILLQQITSSFRWKIP
jgi:hypothetical protein